MSDVTETLVPVTPATTTPTAAEVTRYTAEAQEKIARLRAMAAEFQEDAAGSTLRQAELALARQTSVTALQKACVFVEAAPYVNPGGVLHVEKARDSIAYELAMAGVREEALALARAVDLSILNRKVEPAEGARIVYAVSKSLKRKDRSGVVRSHREELKRELVPRRRRPAAQPAEVTPKTT